MGLSLWVLSACGEEKQTPCSGDNCLNVAGTYLVEASSPEGGNTCERIVYSGSENDSTFSLAFTLTQNESELTYDFQATRVGFTATGTLFDNRTASIKQHLPHVTIRKADGSAEYDYTNDTQVTLLFSEADGVVHVSGTLNDLLTANEESPFDVTCALSASFNGQR